ncbi:MAG: alpha/beta hydrolase, partial [Maricaulaceae bacterium]
RKINMTKFSLKSYAIIPLIALSTALTACGGGGNSSNSSGSNPPPVVVTPPAPQPVRYVDQVFTSVDLESGVVFGSGARANGQSETLSMEIFTPQGDTETNRPVIILAFGGGFVSGTRFNPGVQLVAQDFARRGYVTASIDYRLFEGFPTNQAEVEIGIIKAMHDMKAAVRFFREDAIGANIYGTRSDMIIVGGISAGGITASFTGALDAQDGVAPEVQTFLDQTNGFDGQSSSNLSVSSDVQGIFSISGAVTDFLWIDADTAPIYAAHEEFDTVVPCRAGLTSDGVMLAGGCDMFDRAQSFNVPSQLYLVEGSDGHVGFTSAQFQEFFNEAAVFFEALVP